jgi:hypothetical protein
MVLKGLIVLLLAFSSVPGVVAELVGHANVTDGDTLTVAKQRIRLWGIDASESAEQCITKDGRCLGSGTTSESASTKHAERACFAALRMPSCGLAAGKALSPLGTAEVAAQR